MNFAGRYLELRLACALQAPLKFSCFLLIAVLSQTSLTSAATINSSVTQTGGTYNVNPTAHLYIEAPGTNNARLTLRNNATTNGIVDLHVGNAQTGALSILSGSRLTNTGFSSLGYLAGATGTA